MYVNKNFAIPMAEFQRLKPFESSPAVLWDFVIQQVNKNGIVGFFTFHELVQIDKFVV